MKVRDVPRLLRTVVHVRPGQAVAQLQYKLGRGVARAAPLVPDPEWGLTEPAVPFLGPASHAGCDGESIRLINRELPFEGEPDWNFEAHGPLFAFHLHQFDWVRDPSLSPRKRVEILLHWIEDHDEGVGWSPHPISLRILSWGKLLLTPGALELDSTDRRGILASLGRQAETLMQNPERRLEANHLLSNWLGVVFAGALLRGDHADRWLSCETELRTELDKQIAPDGSHVERSPMYHALLLENLLDLRNLGRAEPGRLPASLDAALEDCTARMLGALEVWTHEDGEIALLGDSAFGIAQRLGELRPYAAALGVTPSGPPTPGWLPGAGSARLGAGPFSLLASVAGPQPSYQPGHAHCDALSFELVVSGERVVTDTGVAEYTSGALRTLSRSTRAHATIEVSGQEQAEIWSSHRIGGRPRVRVESVDPPARIVASCTGWAMPGAVHRRSFAVASDGLEIVDSLEGPARRVTMHLPLAPGLVPALSQPVPGQWVCRVGLRCGGTLRIELPEGVSWSVEEADYLPEFGLAVPRACLVGKADRFVRGCWRFRKDEESFSA